MNFPVFIAIIFIVIFIVFKKYEIVIYGKIGEFLVSRKLKKLDQTKYKILNDLLLPSNGRTATTQIDHLIVSNYGIFCIETKAYQGWIFGNANNEYWTQVIYRYKKRFYNPLRQNYAHTKAIEELIKSKYSKVQIFSLVVFPYADKLQISGTDSVGCMRDIIQKIKSYNNIVLSDIERDGICEILAKENIQNKKDRKLHNQKVKDLQQLGNIQ